MGNTLEKMKFEEPVELVNIVETEVVDIIESEDVGNDTVYKQQLVNELKNELYVQKSGVDINVVVQGLNKISTKEWNHIIALYNRWDNMFGKCIKDDNMLTFEEYVNVCHKVGTVITDSEVAMYVYNKQ